MTLIRTRMHQWFIGVVMVGRFCLWHDSYAKMIAFTRFFSRCSMGANSLNYWRALGMQPNKQLWQRTVSLSSCDILLNAWLFCMQTCAMSNCALCEWIAVQNRIMNAWSSYMAIWMRFLFHLIYTIQRWIGPEFIEALFVCTFPRVTFSVRQWHPMAHDINLKVKIALRWKTVTSLISFYETIGFKPLSANAACVPTKKCSHVPSCVI